MVRLFYTKALVVHSLENRTGNSSPECNKSQAKIPITITGQGTPINFPTGKTVVFLCSFISGSCQLEDDRKMN